MPKRRRAKSSKAKKKKIAKDVITVITNNNEGDDEVKEIPNRSKNHFAKQKLFLQHKKKKKKVYFNDGEKKMENEWGPIKMELIDVLTSLSCLPPSLVESVVGYIDTIQWDPKAFQSWPFLPDGKPRGITTNEMYLYICDCANNSLHMYNLDGELVMDQSNPWPSLAPLLVLSPSSSSSSSPSFSLLPSSINDKPFSQPWAIDYYDSHLYMIDDKQLHILNLKREILSQWKLPSGPGHGVKVDQDFIYITLENIHQIFIYTKLGCLVKKFGAEEKGNKEGQFHRPFGLTLDDSDLYVCDYNNHRVQVLSKDQGLFSHLWGQQGCVDDHFNWPYSIYLFEYVLYVGDCNGVQLFTPQGVFLQRIGQNFWGDDELSFRCAWGTVVVNNRLYVCDCLNHRIQVFRKKNEIPKEILEIQ